MPMLKCTWYAASTTRCYMYLSMGAVEVHAGSAGGGCVVWIVHARVCYMCLASWQPVAGLANESEEFLDFCNLKLSLPLRSPPQSLLPASSHSPPAIRENGLLRSRRMYALAVRPPLYSRRPRPPIFADHVCRYRAMQVSPSSTTG